MLQRLFPLSLIFLERLYPLQDGGVGVVPGGEQPVVDGEAEVVVVQLHQGRLEVLGFPHLGGKLVSLKVSEKSVKSSVLTRTAEVTWNSKCLERTLMRKPMTAE